MSTYRYAAYGSNLHPVRLKHRAPSAKCVGTCELSGFQLRFHKKGWSDESGKCNIVQSSGRVHLAIFELDMNDKAGLDSCEGLGIGYDAHVLRIPGFGECQAYVAEQAAIDELLRPLDWYKEMVLLGCLAHKFPRDYCRAIDAIESIPDPDEERSREQWDIVREMIHMT